MSAYQALYRKWRPMTFDDVVGQKQVSDTLRGSINSGRIAHAYLFCGTRGTGKTSTAKIFSRAVNCENPLDGEPCNQCATCKGILNGSILDVYEMDAASNSGVDNIRDIINEVIYTPVGCKYKVYIIDEVHSLSRDAFNALLKTLEEPPAHALFILATTEPHKIPQTILSRCQRFDFRRIGIDEIARRITKITDTENIDITPDAVELVAELGDGSMRDAISLLDRCASFGEEKLTTDKISDILGIVGSKRLFDITDAVAQNDTKAALCRSGEVLRTGKEPQNLLENLIEHFRCLLVSKATSDSSELLEKTANAAEQYSRQAENLSVERILYSINTLGEYLSQAKWMSNPKVAVEMAMVKLCTPSYATDVDALLARIEKLETTIANMSAGYVAPSPEKTSSPIEDTPPWDVEEAPTPAPAAAPKAPDTTAASMGTDWEYWAEALNEIKKESKTLFAFLYIAKAMQDGNTIIIEVGSKVAYDRIATPGGIEYLSKLFTRINGSPLSAKIYIKGETPEAAQQQGPSINDLAAKKDLMGDKMDII